MKEKISVVVITRNEEKNIGACLESVSWADEVVIVDSGSTDATLDICRKHRAKIFSHPIDKGFSFNKNLGIEKAAGPWIFSLDADERVSPELRADMERALENPGSFCAFRFPRKNYFLGKWIRGCGWWPDRVTRLFKKGKASWKSLVHEDLVVEGPAGDLERPLLHFSYRCLDDYFRKMNLYTSFLARQKIEEGSRISFWNFGWHFLLNPAFVFLRKYFWMGGWRDGFRGFFISCSAALVVWTLAAKIWEDRLKEGKPE